MVAYFLALNLGLVALNLWATLEVQRFLRDHVSIHDSEALEAFKALARRNMIAALVYLPLGIVSVLLAAYLVTQLQLVGLAVALAVFIPSLLLSRNLVVLERRARALDCANDDLREMHQKIGLTWVKKALPDF